MNKVVIATMVCALALGTAPSFAASKQHRVHVDANCKTSAGKVVDCTKEKCVDKKGKAVTACPTAAAEAGAATSAPASQ